MLVSASWALGGCRTKCGPRLTAGHCDGHSHAPLENAMCCKNPSLDLKSLKVVEILRASTAVQRVESLPAELASHLGDGLSPGCSTSQLALG